MVEDQGRWEFYQDGKGKWHWRYENTDQKPVLVRSSTKRFDTLLECTEDATVHGFKRDGSE
jgi:hypothetical protein